MLRKSIVLVLLASLCALITACSSNQSTSDKKDSETVNAPSEEKAEIIVSAAASLKDAAEEIETAFSKENPMIAVIYNFGSSGNLSQQIQQGAPVDVFLTASKKDMDTISEKAMIDEDTRRDFASNELVVVTGKTTDVKLSTLKDISHLDVNHIVLGDPQAVPAGRYAKESLENIGVWSGIEDKIVYVSDVRQVLTQVETGNADLGFVYNTDAIQSKDVKILMKVDAGLHEQIIYPGAMIKASKNEEAAKLYLDFLSSEEGKSILSSYGFITNE